MMTLLLGKYYSMSLDYVVLRLWFIYDFTLIILKKSQIKILDLSCVEWQRNNFWKSEKAKPVQRISEIKSILILLVDV